MNRVKSKVIIRGFSLEVGSDVYWFTPSYRAIVSRRIVSISRGSLSGTWQICVKTPQEGVFGFNNILKLDVDKRGALWTGRYQVGNNINHIFHSYESCRKYIFREFEAKFVREIAPYKCGVTRGLQLA
jgi:hypothetical protein